MNRIVHTMAFLGAAAFAVSPLLADDEEEDVGVEEAEEVVESSDKKDGATDKSYYLLPFCRVAEGLNQVKKPGSTEWEVVEEGRYYPLGSSFRTADDFSRMTVSLGRACHVRMLKKASFGTRAQGLGERSRTLLLESGTIMIDVPRDMPSGMLTVVAPGFAVSNLCGQSSFDYSDVGDGYEAKIRCLTGSFGVCGRHFNVPQLKASNEIKIRTSQDELISVIDGVSGDCAMSVDKGMSYQWDMEKNAQTEQHLWLDWVLSPHTSVRILRAVPKGEMVKTGNRNLAVSVMTFDALGKLQNRYAFAENRPEINSGELGEAVLSKRAEEATKLAEEAAGKAEDVEETEESSDEE